MNKLLNLLGFAVFFVLCLFSVGSNAEENGCSSWVQAREGYTCWAMSKACGISLDSFMNTNGLNLNSCNYIQIGHDYCCN
ncbi:hypothetical protein DDB_G0271110 [Dictyostelium discoideum AX4]|uniref:LysM domain-containing protein n=1 Tax=Dictyostelium discoideum TaxID=44689 RepID=Q55BK6_DICDI|nr:hypothetical protein DDB_G0271110 [Dictyostelium discoideum AX4]EAL71887.1 hypothetical protein DDB_G0271110 [Dictyostelium discoideum AX4]|eukprot:XP_645808.1 hypothetical protein DDB_G0271110 [Dictyostelium discoideum AX4]